VSTAAVVAGAVVAVPLLDDGRPDRGPAPAGPTPSPSPDTVDGQAVDRLRVDVDGDGTPDDVRVVGADLEVALASGTTATWPVGVGARLLPWADVGTSRPGLVVLPAPGAEEGGAVVTWRDGTLTPIDAQGLLADRPGRVVWVDEARALHSGEYDAGVPDDERVLVQATSYHQVRGELLGTPAGEQCWDRLAEATPVPCEQLPAMDADPSLMFPVVEDRYPVGEPHGQFSGDFEKVVLRRAGDEFELSYTWDGVESTAPVRTVVAPELLGSAIASSLDAPAVVVGYESGDSTRMQVYAPTSEGFRALDVAGGRSLGNGFLAGSGGQYLHQRTWTSQRSGLWSAQQVAADEPDRYVVTRWTVDDTTLVPDDQGEACLDFRRNRRLPDATCGAS
jgi:hypothetical protein